jgi:hypothetical protein
MSDPVLFSARLAAALAKVQMKFLAFFTAQIGNGNKLADF